MICKIEGKCQYEGCGEPATLIASGRPHPSQRMDTNHPVGCYCVAHARMVADEDHPEYRDNCPNCGCLFGIN